MSNFNAEQAQDVIKLGGEFDYEGYQVVRREFFAHINEPSVTFNNYKVYVNAACLNRFPTVDYVQVLVNQDNRILAFRPCREEERDAFRWCTSGSERRKPRQITCRLFFAKVFTLMDWNPDYRYKLLGKVIHANDEYLVAFDLSATEVYQRVFEDGEKPKTSRVPVFPEGWPATARDPRAWAPRASTAGARHRPRGPGTRRRRRRSPCRAGSP